MSLHKNSKLLGSQVGYQLLKLGSLMQFLVALGYQATTKSYTDKQDANIQRQQDTPINTINYFASSSNTDADKKKKQRDDADNTQQIW